jgi:two-component system chemotaxis response regulator CheB
VLALVDARKPAARPIAADCALDVALAIDGEPLRSGTIRIAPPDRHLTVEDGAARLMRSAKENFARPTIDPLFRSAALDFDSRVIGVVLTGMLDDGTAGLQAIKSAGGIAVVQDPADAMEPSMPTSALRHVDVDHSVPLVEMPALLARLVSSQAGKRTTDMTESRRRMSHEQALSEGTGDYFGHLRAIGDPSPLTCPECHGGLWHLRDSSPRRYRCHTGHGFTARTLNLAVEEESDNALWSAPRCSASSRRPAVRRAVSTRPWNWAAPPTSCAKRGTCASCWRSRPAPRDERRTGAPRFQYLDGVLQVFPTV